MRPFVLLCAAMLAGVLAAPADARPRDKEKEQLRHERRADDDRRSDDGRRERRPQPSAAAAARLAQERNGGGRVLAVDPAGDGYRVKLLKDGEVRTFVIAPE